MCLVMVTTGLIRAWASYIRPKYKLDWKAQQANIAFKAILTLF